MGRRGRPPYPDVLTPREWEVHALLREGLSNEEIAQRLGISLAGAKYHVSEILGKLGVASREEASRWTPGRRPWWATAALAPVAGLWRRAGSSWLATGAAAGAFVVVAAGLGLLIWGLLRTSGDGDESTVTCVPGEIANYFVDVDQVGADSFRGEASSTLETPLGGSVTVNVNDDTGWLGPAQSIDGIEPGMRVQAVGPSANDCSITAANVFSPLTPGSPVLLGEGNYGGADWSPDGRSVAFALDGVLYRADGPQFERYKHGPLVEEPLPYLVTSPKWSPDGTRIAFVSSPAGRFGDAALDSLTIYVVNADGTGLRDLLPGAAADLAPTDLKELEGWLDNDTVLFDQGCGTACRQPYLLHVETGELEPVVRVTNATTGAEEAGILGAAYFYSPDRRWIAVEDLSLPTVSVYDRETGEQRLLVPQRERLTPWQWFGSWAPDSSAILYDSAESEDGLQYTPPFSLHLYDVATGEDRVLAELGKRGVFSADSSLVTYVTEATEERPCGGDARVACIAVMDISSGEELYRFAGPSSDVLEGYPDGWFPPTFVPDDRVLYTTAAGDFAIADGEGTGLLLNADNVIDVLLSPDGSSALVAEPGRLTLVPIPPRDSPTLPEPAPLSRPDGGPIAATPTPEPFVGSQIDCAGGFPTPEEAIEACYALREGEIFIGDCDTPVEAPPGRGLDRPCTIWEDGSGPLRSYMVSGIGVDGYARYLVELRADGWVAIQRSGCSVQSNFDLRQLREAQGVDISQVFADECAIPPAPIPRPVLHLGPRIGATVDNGNTELRVGAETYYPGRGIKIQISTLNVSGETLPWTSDVGAPIHLVAQDGTSYAPSEVGGTLARTVSTGIPDAKAYNGWLVFPIDEFGVYTLRYPGQPDVVRDLTPDAYRAPLRDSKDENP